MFVIRPDSGRGGECYEGIETVRTVSNPILETQSRNSKLVGMARKFKDLTEREILALAISLEEEDGRVYADFAEGLRETYPATAKLFDDMGAEESEHRASLFETYRARFGEHIPLIRREDVKGFAQRKPFWLDASLEDCRCAEASGTDGTGDAPVLSEGDWAGDGCRDPETAGRSGGDRTQASGGGGGDVRRALRMTVKKVGGRSAAPSVRLANRAARSGGA